jgi:hypothetical protein
VESDVATEEPVEEPVEELVLALDLAPEEAEEAEEAMRCIQLPSPEARLTQTQLLLGLPETVRELLV